MDTRGFLICAPGFFDSNPRTGASIEVFYADRALETFGRCGAGEFNWSKREIAANHAAASVTSAAELTITMS